VIEGRVTKLVPFGAFVEVDDAIEGLVHISELADHHVERAEDEVGVHDRVEVKIIDIDLDRRRISLSRKQAMAPTTDEAGVPVGEGTSVAIEDTGDVDEAAPVSEMELEAEPEAEPDSGMEVEADTGAADEPVAESGVAAPPAVADEIAEEKAEPEAEELAASEAAAGAEPEPEAEEAPAAAAEPTADAEEDADEGAEGDDSIESIVKDLKRKSGQS
jgi:small subunit ribosomal protein S1